MILDNNFDLALLENIESVELPISELLDEFAANSLMTFMLCQ